MNPKVVLLGQASVGKSCLVSRLIKNVFYDNMLETVGASFAFYQTPENKFELWDTAGQERYAPISRIYYYNAHIIIIVFDLGSKTSWKRVNTLIYEVREVNKTGHIIIVGNKIDLQSTVPFEKWVHPLIEGQEADIIYVSAKEGKGIDLLKDRLQHYVQIIPPTDAEIIDLNQKPVNSCC